MTLGSNPNYSVTSTDGTLTVNAAVATVTANNKSKTYGDANPALDATVVGQVVGGDAIDYTLATAAPQFSNVGGNPYGITVTLGSNPNYSVTSTDGTLTVNATVATVTAINKSKTYGDANPALDATVVGQVVGGDAIDYTLATTATQFSNVAGNPYGITVTLGSNPNYSVTKTDGTLTVNATVATVTADNKSKTYGDDNPALTRRWWAGGRRRRDRLHAGHGGDEVLGGGRPYPITVTLGSNPNYNVTSTDGTLTVNAAVATVTADNKSKTYGDDNPALDATVVGQVVGGDAINYTLATTATKFIERGGQYPITVTLGSNPNYSVTTTDGTLTINAEAATRHGRQQEQDLRRRQPGADATVVGQVVGGDTINYTLATAATKFSGVAGNPYGITVTLGSNPNYNVTSTDGTLTVNAEAATVTANNKSKTYGDDNPALDATVVGIVDGDAIDYTLATTATKFSNVAGTYRITVTLGSNPNYSVTSTDGTLTIKPQAATVTADNKSKTYGDDNPALDATVVGHGQRRHAQLHAGHGGDEVQQRGRQPVRDHGDPGLQPELQRHHDRRHADGQCRGRHGHGRQQEQDLRRRQPDAGRDGRGPRSTATRSTTRWPRRRRSSATWAATLGSR